MPAAATKSVMVLSRDQAEDSMAEKRQAQRYAKRALLAKQAGNGKSRQALRRMVEERLSHPLLEQMHSAEFELNPLQEAEEDFVPSLAKWMASQMEGAGEEEPRQQASVTGGASSSSRGASRGASRAASPAVPLGDGLSGESGLSELVALKRHLERDACYASGLAVDEFIRALGELWKQRTPQELRRLFLQIDADSDGRVTWEELLTHLLQKDSGGGEEENRFLPSVDAVSAPDWHRIAADGH